MGKSMANASFFSDICTVRCKGMCCDPWWGIISYNAVKNGGLSNLDEFKAELVKGIKAREKRIVEGYVTKEARSRSLFVSPEKYNVTIREIKINGNSIALSIMAMFAFRCLFLSGDKACMIHPAVIGGDDIRPPHCGYMGSLHVRPGEKGYCRIIHAAESGIEAEVNRAVQMEKGSSDAHFRGGVKTAEEAAGNLIEWIKAYCAKNALELFSLQSEQKQPGRNAPCHCGSGAKFKKCHGR
ncbi:MAG: SEC-C domain-containing protein [Deltaproteobacteria bacterium]|nr:SEC-C domain-containing protein [Deltaproteobacteria bacterium]